MSFAQPAQIFTRRAALTGGALAVLLPGRTGAARPPAAPPTLPADDGLGQAAREMSDSFDLMGRAQAAYDTSRRLSEMSPDRACDGSAGDAWEAAHDRITAAEKALYGLMRERGVVAVVADGRLYIDNARSLGTDTEAEVFYITAVPVGALVSIGPDAWGGGR